LLFRPSPWRARFIARRKWFPTSSEWHVCEDSFGSIQFRGGSLGPPHGRGSPLAHSVYEPCRTDCAPLRGGSRQEHQHRCPGRSHPVARSRKAPARQSSTAGKILRGAVSRLRCDALIRLLKKLVLPCFPAYIPRRHRVNHDL